MTRTFLLIVLFLPFSAIGNDVSGINEKKQHFSTHIKKCTTIKTFLGSQDICTADYYFEGEVATKMQISPEVKIWAKFELNHPVSFSTGYKEITDRSGGFCSGVSGYSIAGSGVNICGDIENLNVDVNTQKASYDLVGKLQLKVGIPVTGPSWDVTKDIVRIHESN